MSESPVKDAGDEAKEIIGRAANPFHKENWEADFELPGSLDMEEETPRAGDAASFLEKGSTLAGSAIWDTGSPRHVSHASITASSSALLDPAGPSLNQRDQNTPGGPAPPADGNASSGSDWDAEIGGIGETIGSPAHMGSPRTDAFQGFESMSGDDEDWDADVTVEPSRDDGVSSAPFSLDFGGDEKSSAGADPVPPVDNITRYSLLTRLSNEQSQGRYNIVTYPESPQLFTESAAPTPGGSAYIYRDKQLVQWLKSFGESAREVARRVEGRPEGGDDEDDDDVLVGDDVAKEDQKSQEKAAASTDAATDAATDATTDASKTQKNAGTTEPTTQTLSPKRTRVPIDRAASPHVSVGEGEDSLPSLLTQCASVVEGALHEQPELIPGIVAQYVEYMRVNAKTPQISMFRDDWRSAEILYSILHTSAQVEAVHPHVIRTAIVCFPLHGPLFNLLRFESNAHHNGVLAQINLRMFCQIYAEQRSVADAAGDARGQGGGDAKATPSPADPQADGKRSDGKRSDSAEKINASQQHRPKTARTKLKVAYQVQGRALASLHLYLDNRSPLDWRELGDAAQYDPLDDPDAFEWLLNAFDGKVLSDPKDKLLALTQSLCGDEALRMRALERVYKKMDPFESLAKAQAAFALAKYLSEDIQSDDTLGDAATAHEQSALGGAATSGALATHHNSRTAENLALECIYVLHRHATKLKVKLTPMLSHVGVSALVLFGNILNANSKYVYAVHAFESAISVHRACTRERFYALMNRLSTLCDKHSDWRRALKYHVGIMEKAKVEGNLNMYVYIVQQVSKIHTKAGDFLNAMQHLRTAIEVLNECIKEKNPMPQSHRDAAALTVHTRNLTRLQTLNLRGGRGLARDGKAGHGASNGKSPRVDYFPDVHPMELRNQKVNLYLRLAQHFLDARRIIEAIVVLEFLLREDGKLPRGKISVVHLLLATAYTKRRLYQCADHLAKHMQVIAEDNKGAAPNFKIPGAEKFTFNAEFTPILGVSKSEVVKTKEFAQLCAKIEYSSGNFSNARLWTRSFIQTASASSLSLGQRGLFYYRMGKILQGKVYQDLIMGNVGGSPNKIEAFPDLRECMKEFDQAYTYFDKVEDRIHIAKTLSRIVETYLEIAFTAAGLLQQPPSDLYGWLCQSGFAGDAGAAPATGVDAKTDSTKAATAAAADAAFAGFLAKIERPAFDALDVAMDAFHPLLYLKCLMNIAEIRFLQSRYDSALQFWRECKNTLFATGMNSERCVLVDRATPGMTSGVKGIFRRLVRMLACFPPDLINANLILLDSFVLYDIELFADVQQCTPERIWARPERTGAGAGGDSTADRSGSASSDNTLGLRAQRLRHMRGQRHDETDIFNNDTRIMFETRKWLRQRKTPEPLALEKHWRRHLSAYMGAVGSRSVSKSLHHDLAGSMIYDSYLDKPSYKRAIEIRDAVCSHFYQISLNFSQAVAGRLGDAEMIDRNRSDLQAIIRQMDRLRNLTYQKSGREGGLMCGFSPDKRRPSISTGRARRVSTVWMSEFVAYSEGDPIWANLTYVVPLGSALLTYAPRSRVKIVQKITSADRLESKEVSLRIGEDCLVGQFDAFWQRRERETVERRREESGSGSGGVVGAGGADERPSSDARAASAAREALILRAAERVGMRLRRQGRGSGVGAPPAMHLPPSAGGSSGDMKTASVGETSPPGDIFDALRTPSKGVGSPPTRPLAPAAAPSTRGGRQPRASSQMPKPRLARTPTHRGPSKPTRVSLRARGRKLQLGGARVDRCVLQVFDSYDKLCETKVASAASGEAEWGAASFIIDASQPKKILTLVVWGSGAKRRAPSLVGQIHVSTHALLAMKAKTERSLEMSSLLHSNVRLVNETSPGRIVFLSVSSEPCAETPADPLQASLSFPELKGGEAPCSPVPGELEQPEFDQVLVKEFLHALDRQNILSLLAAMLNECQIILTSQNNFRLKAAINCLLKLMYPFQWQHTLIPLLPRACASVLRTKRPYIIAVNHFMFADCRPLLPAKAVVVMLDHNQIRVEPGSFVPLPPSVKNGLSTAIQKYQITMFRSLMANASYRQEVSATFASTLHPQKRRTAPGKRQNGGLAAVSEAGSADVASAGRTGGSGGGSGGGGASFRRSGETSADFEDALEKLKKEFVGAFVHVFYKVRLYWSWKPERPLDVHKFLNSTSHEFKAFVHAFVRTRIFARFLLARAPLGVAGHTTGATFDDAVYARVVSEYSDIKARRAAKHSGFLLCQKGKGRWKRRFVELSGNILNVYKYNRSKGPKYTRELKPGFFVVHAPVSQTHAKFFAFELRNAWEAEKNESTLSFRAGAAPERKAWVAMIRARVLSPALDKQYNYIQARYRPWAERLGLEARAAGEDAKDGKE